MKKPKDVDSYIKAAPREARAKLLELRKIIKTTAPKANERLSYGMPYYHYKGRVAYFRAARNHIGLYIPTPVVAEHTKELKDYAISKATIHFPLDRKLPGALIRKLIKARIRKNEDAAKQN